MYRYSLGRIEQQPLRDPGRVILNCRARCRWAYGPPGHAREVRSSTYSGDDHSELLAKSLLLNEDRNRYHAGPETRGGALLCLRCPQAMQISTMAKIGMVWGALHSQLRCCAQLRRGVNFPGGGEFPEGVVNFRGERISPGGEGGALLSRDCCR